MPNPGTRDAATGLWVQWDTDALMAKNEEGFKRGARVAAAFLAGEIKKNIGQAQSPPVSQPGQFPHIGARGVRVSKPYAQLRNSIQSAPTARGARVGSTVKYGFFLEMGTSKMEPRPFISRTFAENFSQVQRIVEQAVAAAHGG